MDPLTSNNLILGVAAWVIAFVVVFWISLMIWAYRDIRSRLRDPLIRVLAVLIVALLFLPGLVIYLILRPQRTLEEEYQHTLEEEALLQSIEESPLCPGCGRRIRDAWMVCPNCHTKLRKPCHQCGKLMDIPWNLCPFCGTPAPGMRRENITMDEALRPLPVEQDLETELEPQSELLPEPESDPTPPAESDSK